MNFSYKGIEDELFKLREGFTFPSFAKRVEYHPSTHASRRRKKRQTREPFTFSVPIILLEGRDKISRDALTARLSDLLYSDGPEIFKIEGTDWHYVGEFTGPFYIPPYFDKFTTVEVQFVSPYSHKFYDDPFTQEGEIITVITKSQLPVTPLIELTNLEGRDVQISINGDDFERMRLTGNLPEKLTIDIESERIYETNSGLDQSRLLRIDSAFEDFELEHMDVVTLTNAGEFANMRLTYKELLL